jgi:hypothetical protein
MSPGNNAGKHQESKMDGDFPADTFFSGHGKPAENHARETPAESGMDGPEAGTDLPDVGGSTGGDVLDALESLGDAALNVTGEIFGHLLDGL